MKLLALAAAAWWFFLREPPKKTAAPLRMDPLFIEGDPTPDEDGWAPWPEESEET